jgi:feruloyl esterase
MAAQRYPEDFDGIIAGAPANRHIHMHVAQSYLHIFNNRNPEYANSYQYTADLINRSVLQKCDLLGDGFLNEPRQCQFDFETIRCSPEAGDSAFSESCLWEHQTIETQEYYGPGHDCPSISSRLQPSSGTPSASSVSRTRTTTGARSISTATCR